MSQAHEPLPPHTQPLSPTPFEQPGIATAPVEPSAPLTESESRFGADFHDLLTPEAQVSVSMAQVTDIHKEAYLHQQLKEGAAVLSPEKQAQRMVMNAAEAGDMRTLVAISQGNYPPALRELIAADAREAAANPRPVGSVTLTDWLQKVAFRHATPLIASSLVAKGLVPGYKTDTEGSRPAVRVATTQAPLIEQPADSGQREPSSAKNLGPAFAGRKIVESETVPAPETTPPTQTNDRGANIARRLAAASFMGARRKPTEARVVRTVPQPENRATDTLVMPLVRKSTATYRSQASPRGAHRPAAGRKNASQLLREAQAGARPQAPGLQVASHRRPHFGTRIRNGISNLARKLTRQR